MEIEPGGAIPVRGLPGVHVVEAPTFADVERVYQSLRKQQDSKDSNFPDVVVLDTVTYLADSTRQLLAMGDRAGASLWANRAQFLTDQRPSYGAMSSIVNRLLMEFRGLSTVTIFILHEEDRISPDGQERRGPSINPALLNPILAWSDVLANLGKLRGETKVADRVIPAGTRRIRLEESDTVMAKARVPISLQPCPAVLIDPSLDDLLAVVMEPEQKACRMTIYGSPGIGKSTLACGGYNKVKEYIAARASSDKS